MDQVPREASSLKLLREKVNPQKEFAGLSVWPPHTKGETGSESRWTLLWCLWRPPSLPEWFPFWVFFLVMSTLQRTRSSPWYITNGHHPKNWKETGTPLRAVQCQQHSQVTSECAYVAASDFLADKISLSRVLLCRSTCRERSAKNLDSGLFPYSVVEFHVKVDYSNTYSCVCLCLLPGFLLIWIHVWRGFVCLGWGSLRWHHHPVFPRSFSLV